MNEKYIPQLDEKIREMKQLMTEAGIDPSKGLGTDLFLFASTLMPIVNVDLLTTNDKHQILLSWRDDEFSGKGWHVPGGCIRFGEHIEERIQKTAISELGTEVDYIGRPFGVYEFLNGPEALKRKNYERCHTVSLPFVCIVPDSYEIPTEKEWDEKHCIPGTLRWFDEPPADVIECHRCYKDLLNQITTFTREDIVHNTEHIHTNLEG